MGPQKMIVSGSKEVKENIKIVTIIFQSNVECRKLKRKPSQFLKLIKNLSSGNRKSQP